MKNLNDRFYNGYLLMNCIFIADFFPWKLLAYTVLILILGAHVIAAIASIEIPLRQWNELLPLINRCCTSQQVYERELGAFVLFTILESIVEGFSQYMNELFGLFHQLLQDPESADVRVTAARALGVLAQYIGSDEKNEIQQFQQLLPALIAVVQGCLNSSDKTGARQLLDVFEMLLILEVL